MNNIELVYILKPDVSKQYHNEIDNKMEKSIVVMVERKVKHLLYGKFVKKSTKFIAHDQENTCNEGDIVQIMEIRPMSKNKNWRLVEIIERAK